MKYIKTTLIDKDGKEIEKVFDNNTLIDSTKVQAVDPNHWETQIQQLQEKVKDLQAQIDDINNNQIPALQAEQTDFFAEFPELDFNHPAPEPSPVQIAPADTVTPDVPADAPADTVQ